MVKSYLRINYCSDLCIRNLFYYLDYYLIYKKIYLICYQYNCIMAFNIYSTLPALKNTLLLISFIIFKRSKFSLHYYNQCYVPNSYNKTHTVYFFSLYMY